MEHRTFALSDKLESDVHATELWKEAGKTVEIIVKIVKAPMIVYSDQARY